MRPNGQTQDLQRQTPGNLRFTPVLDYRFVECEEAAGITIYVAADPVAPLGPDDTINGIVARLTFSVRGGTSGCAGWGSSTTQWAAIQNVEFDVGLGRTLSLPAQQVQVEMAYAPVVLQGQTAPDRVRATALAGEGIRSSTSGVAASARRTYGGVVTANGVSTPIPIPPLATSVIVLPLAPATNLANVAIAQIQSPTQQVVVAESVAGGSRDIDATPLVPDARAVFLRMLNGAPDATFNVIFLLAL